MKTATRTPDWQGDLVWRNGWITVLRDLVMLLTGTFVVLYGTIKGGEFVVFLTGVSLMGGPAVLHLLWFGRSAGESQSPPSHSDSSSPPS